jgi:hypothetical protein
MESLPFSHYQIFYNAVYFMITALLAAFFAGRGSGRDRTGLIKITQSE